MIYIMDVGKILADLKQEHAQITIAIQCLERLAAGRGKRRGRPLAWLSQVKATTQRRGRPPGSKNKPKDAEGAN